MNNRVKRKIMKNINIPINFKEPNGKWDGDQININNLNEMYESNRFNDKKILDEVMEALYELTSFQEGWEETIKKFEDFQKRFINFTE